MNVRRSSIIKAGCDHPLAAAAMPAPDTTTPVASTKMPEVRPKLVLHRDGDLIEAIEVTCPCGHTMIFECEYEDTQKS